MAKSSKKYKKNVDKFVSTAERTGAAKQFRRRLTAPATIANSVPVDVPQRKEEALRIARQKKQALIARLKQHEFGGLPKGTAAKAFYGPDYKRGTVAKLNKRIATGRKLSGKADKSLTALRTQAQATSDPAAQQALAARAQQLSATAAKQKRQLQVSEKQRQKYLDLRNKALQTIAVNVQANPQALEQARLRKVRKKYRQLTA